MEVRSLKDLSYATVVSYVLIGDYSMSELLRLPTVPRYQLFDTLTVLEIWRLETGIDSGVSRISVRGVLEGEVPRVREGRSRECGRGARKLFEDIFYEASWFHVHHAASAQ